MTFSARIGCVALAILTTAAFADGRDARDSKTRRDAKSDRKQKAEKYLSKSGEELKREFVFEQLETGVASKPSGYRLTVKADGSWKFAVVTVGKVKDTDLKGELSKEQIRQIAEKMASTRHTELPEEFGSELDQKNHRTYSMSFGRQSTQLMLAPGRDIEWATKNAEKTKEKHWERFAEVAELVQKSVRWDRLILGKDGD